MRKAVFEALMQRHGPMVLGVSQRVLCHPHDAEDVFQLRSGAGRKANRSASKPR